MLLNVAEYKILACAKSNRFHVQKRKRPIVTRLSLERAAANIQIILS